jgi:hypothetical protein
MDERRAGTSVSGGERGAESMCKGPGAQKSFEEPRPKQPAVSKKVEGLGRRVHRQPVMSPSDMLLILRCFSVAVKGRASVFCNEQVHGARMKGSACVS